MLPAYQQIAAEIRGRIHSGELRPGSRVPSARQITQQWGVAIATATKVLMTLQRDGLVKAVPGVGTVVIAQSRVDTSPQSVPKASLPLETGLNRDRIVRAAIEIADAEGMASLSMRRLGTDLGFATMSLYRHVRNRDELVLLMIDVVFGEARLPAERPAGWRAQLEVAANMIWELFRRHRWLATSMSLTRPQLAPNALAYTEWIMRALSGLGLDPGELVHTHVMLFSYMRGLAMSFETEAEAEQDTGMTSDEWMSTQEGSLNAIAGSGAFGTFVRLMRDFEFEFDLDSLYQFGLARMLDGLTVHIGRRV